jgi:tetratricopeptide (TPR) repeat protein
MSKNALKNTSLILSLAQVVSVFTVAAFAQNQAPIAPVSPTTTPKGIPFPYFEMQRFKTMFDSRDLFAEDAAQLEEALKSDPMKIEDRLKLLGYYMGNRYHSPEVKAKRIAHISWFVDNAVDQLPDGPFVQVMRTIDGRKAYFEIKQKWIAQLEKHPTDLTVLEHASQFFLFDEKPLAEDCLKKAKVVEPDSSEWPKKLAHLYYLWGPGFESAALEESELAFKLEPSASGKFYIFTDIPMFAFNAGDMTKAEQTASDLIAQASQFKRDWNHGNALNKGHTTLGLVALRKGDRDKAKHHLIQSTIDVSSPQNDSFGPDPTLAAEMLELGETDAVIDYWQRCREFWLTQDRFDEFCKSTKNGKMPAPYRPNRSLEFSRLTDEPRRQFAKGDLGMAKEVSQKLLDMSEKQKDNERHYGFAVHEANIVLGQVAFKEGNIEEALNRLEKACDVPDSTRLKEHGPDLTLAAQLIKSGKRAEVEHSLRKIERYWLAELPPMKDFLDQAERGVIPYDLLW